MAIRAEVAELVDALGSGSSEGSLVGVRVSPSAPPKNRVRLRGLAMPAPFFIRGVRRYLWFLPVLLIFVLENSATSRVPDNVARKYNHSEQDIKIFQ